MIIKHLFDPKDPETMRPDFYDNLKNEIRGELEKMGPVASIKIFEVFIIYHSIEFIRKKNKNDMG